MSVRIRSPKKTPPGGDISIDVGVVLGLILGQDFRDAATAGFNTKAGDDLLAKQANFPVFCLRCYRGHHEEIGHDR